MKSMLHEASSIIKAVEKAWIESGKPAAFTIKILEKGEKNFLGMVKRPAIVSITYGQDVVFDKQKNKNFTQARAFNKPQEQSGANGSIENRDRQHNPKPVSRDNVRRYDAPLKNIDTPSLKKEISIDKEKTLDREIISWSSEMVDYCSINLKEILNTLKVESFFTAKINNRNLIITFDKNIVNFIPEDLKSFFASVAHILMQLLKRKYKKRLKGIQIIINHTISHDTSNSKPN